MKIALIFYGQLRWFDIFRDSFEMTMEDVTVFAHFWRSDEASLSNFKSMFPNSLVQIDDQESMESMRRNFGIIDAKVSPNMVSQLCSMKRAWDLVNGEFDIYVKMRSDLCFKSRLSLNEIENDWLYTLRTNEPIERHVVDFVSCTRRKHIMQIMCEMGFSLQTISENLDSSEMHADLYHHETLLSHYLKMLSIDVKWLSSDVRLARFC